jgi:CDGSH-type Zn-finger protein
MADIKITALKNGPYKVEGPIELFYGDLRVDTRQPTVFLCRCGASSKKRFCDGTHSKIASRPRPQRCLRARRNKTDHVYNRTQASSVSKCGAPM